MLTPRERDAAQALADALVGAYRGWMLEHPNICLGVALAGLTSGLADVFTPVIRHGALPGHSTAAIDELLQVVRSELVSREL
jgi:hypothetical protein